MSRITYNDNSVMSVVFLDGKHIGDIIKLEPGWQWKPLDSMQWGEKHIVREQAKFEVEALYPG